MLVGYVTGTPITVSGSITEVFSVIDSSHYHVDTTIVNPYALPIYPVSGSTGIGGYPNLDAGYTYGSERPTIIAVLKPVVTGLPNGLLPQFGQVQSVFNHSGTPSAGYLSNGRTWAFAGNYYGVVPVNSPASTRGTATVTVPNNTGGWSTVETGLYPYTPNGWVYQGDGSWPSDSETWYGVNVTKEWYDTGDVVGHIDSGFTAQITWDLIVYHYKGVYGDVPWPPETSTDLQQLYGLSVDRMPFGLTRQILNVGFTSTPISEVRFYDLDQTSDVISTGLAGHSPTIKCLDNGQHLLCYSDGTNLVAVIIDDNGTVVTTMASPGTGKLNSQAVVDKTGVIWIAACNNDTGTAATLVVYRSLDGGSTWASVGTGLPSAGSVDAQAPQLVGDIADLQLWYHDGGNIYGLRSRDSGATWSAI